MKHGRLLSCGLLGLGAAVLLLELLDVRTPMRAWLTLAFFAVAPGTAVVSRLRLGDALLAASLVLGVSVVISMGVAMTMLWTGLWSAPGATAAVLALTAGAAVAPNARDVKGAHR